MPPGPFGLSVSRQPSPAQGALLCPARPLVLHPLELVPPLVPLPLSGSSASQPEALGWSDPFPAFIWCLVSGLGEFFLHFLRTLLDP